MCSVPALLAPSVLLPGNQPDACSCLPLCSSAARAPSAPHKLPALPAPHLLMHPVLPWIADSMVVRVLMGDPWEGGARVQLEFPFQPRCVLCVAAVC